MESLSDKAAVVDTVDTVDAVDAVDDGAEGRIEERAARIRSVGRNLCLLRRDYPPLTLEEEQEMCARHAGNRERLNELLVLHNVGFAMAYGRRYSERCEDVEDLWMRGVQGLSRAAESFDPSRGTKFTTYATYYIQQAMRDLFDRNLSGPQAQLLTSPVYDAPVRRDAASGTRDAAATLGDRLVQDGAVPGWSPVRPDSETKRQSAAEGVAELISYLAQRFGENERERRAIWARLSRWDYRRIGQEVLGGVTRQCAQQLCERCINNICCAINRLEEGDELYGVLSRTVHTVPRYIEPEALYSFLASNSVEIADDVELEDYDARSARMLEEFDRAAAEHQVATGRRGGGADYDMMRAIYSDAVVGADKMEVAAFRLGVPESYALFLRDRAVRMVQDHKSGRLRRLYERDPEKVDHAAKDELFNVGGAGRVHCNTVSYGKLVSGGVGWRKRDLVTTWKSWRGGFYSHVSHLRMANRHRLGKYRISKREALALGRYCDDVPAWVTAGHGVTAAAATRPATAASAPAAPRTPALPMEGGVPVLPLTLPISSTPSAQSTRSLPPGLLPALPPALPFVPIDAAAER